MPQNARERTCALFFAGDTRAQPDPRQLVLKGFENLVGEVKRPSCRLKQLRLERMMSKTELARKAGVSPITISRIESGQPARLETKRKLLEALGLSPSDRIFVFADEDNLKMP